MKTKCIYVCYILLFIIYIAGCGSRQEKMKEESFEFGDNISEEEEDDFDRTGLTWDNTKWVNPLTIDSTNRLYVKEYYTYSWSNSSARGITSRIYGNTFYRLEEVESEDGYDYCIEAYDANLNKGILINLNKDILIAGNPNRHLEDLYIMNENEFIIMVSTIEEGQLTEVVAYHLNGEGEVCKTVDFSDAYIKSGTYTQPLVEAWCGLVTGYIMAVDDGHYYCGTYHRTPIMVTDLEGKLVDVLTTAKAEGRIESNYDMKCIKMSNGQPIFWCQEGNISTFYTYNDEHGAAQLIQNDNYPNRARFSFNEDGYCFLMNGEWLYRWDIFTGKSIKMLNVENEGISVNGRSVRIAMQDTGCPVLYTAENDCVEIYKLDYEKPNTDNYLTVVSFSNNCKELEAACADYTRHHPQGGIRVVKPTGDVDAYRTRLLAEMVAGKGPDAMYVTAADFKILYEKGLLEDLSGYLSSELEKDVFKGVLDCGKIDGKQFGYPIIATLSSMLVDERVWDKDTWSVLDVMNMAKSGRLPNLESLVLLNPTVWHMEHFSIGVLQALALQNLDDTPFLDLEKKTCSFDSPEFIQLLELCKEYPKTLVSAERDIRKEVDKGSLLTYVGDVRTLQKFSETMYDTGETFKCVGFPSQEGYGSYWQYEYLLVVRKGSDKKNTLLNMIESLYEVSNQRKLSNSVNRTVFRLYAEKSSQVEGYFSIDQGNGRSLGIREKSDGTDWIQEYLDLADKAVPLPHDADLAAQIVREEVPAYFNGSKDAESVAKIIQNRVKLWMMEQM